MRLSSHPEITMRLFASITSWILSCVAMAGAAVAQYRFDALTTDDGLPQNSVYSILQTRDGYIWLTTLDGLARYDGVRFRVFDKSNTKGINSNRFNLLFEDAEGGLMQSLTCESHARSQSVYTQYNQASTLLAVAVRWSRPTGG